MYIDYYRGKKAMPIVVDIFNKSEVATTEDHVKIWSTPRMRYSDILVGIQFAQRTGKSHLIYTNKVDDMIKKEALKFGVTIYDIQDVIDKSKSSQLFFDLYDLISE